MSTPEERRAKDAARKRKERAAAPPKITLSLPKGTADALARVLERAGFDSAADFVAFQIHRLDALDSPEFEAQAMRTVRVGDVSKWYGQLQAVGRAESEKEDDE